MRWLERWFGVLAGALGIIALAITLSQHTERIMLGGAVMYGPGSDTANTLAVVLPVGLAVVASLGASFAAVRDSRLASARGLWTGLLAIAALFCVAGVVMLKLNNVWVETGSPPNLTSQISAAVVFAPAALAAIISMFTALRPRAAHA